MPEGIAHAVVQLVYVYGDYSRSCDDDSEIGPYLLILRSQRELLYYKVVVKVEVDAEKDDIIASRRVDLPDRLALMCPASRLGTIRPILPTQPQLAQVGRMMHNSIISVRMLKPRAVGMPTREETCNGKEVEYRYRAA